MDENTSDRGGLDRTGSDHSFYDPSIADVWTLPNGADAVAPQVTVEISPALPERANGWYCSSQVTASLVGRIDQGVGVVQLSAADATSGVAETWYRVNAGDWIQGSAVELAGAGTYAVQYRSVDVAGNVEEPKGQSVTVTGQVPCLPELARYCGTASITGLGPTTRFPLQSTAMAPPGCRLGP